MLSLLSTTKTLTYDNPRYLPTCALIALGFGIANALEQHNTRHMNTRERDGYLSERNQALLDAYGERMSLHDVERALEIYEVL